MDPGGGGEDRLSALPVDVLVLILLRLDTIAAGQTSILSHRWRRLWALLPELRFPADADLRLVASALAAHEAAISYLEVRTLDAAPESAEACLALAAGRLSGRLVFQNRLSSGGNAANGGETGGFDLTCLHNATAVSLDLGFLSLVMPNTGVFARLTELSLERVRFQGSWELDDAASSPRCPCLQKLSVAYSRVMADLFIHSKSLLQLNLKCLDGLRQLSIVAQALNKLDLFHCFSANGSFGACIWTPQLVSLAWMDLHDSTFVHLGNLPQLQFLKGYFWVYVPHDSRLNRSFPRLLKKFQFIQKLQITLVYDKVPYRCPSGCVCDQPSDWKTEELTLNCLQGVCINMEAGDHQVAFVKRLFTWAVVLKRIQINFDSSLMSDCKVMELRQTLSSFARPETGVEFYMYQNEGVKFSGKRYLLAP